MERGDDKTKSAATLFVEVRGIARGKSDGDGGAGFTPQGDRASLVTCQDWIFAVKGDVKRVS
jgi:hypothetical protein